MGIKIIQGGVTLDPGSAYTFGFNVFDILISLAFIGLTTWLVAVNHEKITELVNDKLLASLNRISDATENQPLYEVFYGWKHRKVEAWVQWIQGQSAKKQAKAFAKLLEHLEETPKELGLITKEVVKAIVLLDKEESFSVLKTLSSNTRKAWGKYKSLTAFYEDAVIGLVELSPKLAKQFLEDEMKFAHGLSDEDSLKRSIVMALASQEEIEDVVSSFKKLTRDSSNSISVRAFALEKLKKLDEVAAFDLVIYLLKDQLKKKEKDYAIFEYCFSNLVNNFEEQDSDMLKDLVLKIIEDPLLVSAATKLLSNIISDSHFKIESGFVFDIFHRLINREKSVFKRALMRRYKISKAEEAIINAADNIERIKAEDIFPKEVIHSETVELEYPVPEFMEDNFEQLKRSLKPLRARDGMTLILGEAELEKYYLFKSCMNGVNKRLIYVDTDEILLSPVKIIELNKMIESQKPCVVYLSDVTQFLKQISGSNPNRQARNLMEMCRKLHRDSKVGIYASLNKGFEDLKHDQNLLSLVDKIPNENFCEKISFTALTDKQKQKIFYHYELKVSEERDHSLEGFDTILNNTEQFSNIKYLRFLLKYMRSSLLTHGQLMPMLDYLSYMAKIEGRKLQES